MVPMLDTAASIIEQTDVVIIIGTSMQVYPAASLVGYANYDVPIYYVDPRPSLNHELSQIRHLNVIPERVTIGVKMVVEKLLK